MKRLTPMKAIRQKCLWCSMDSSLEVKICFDKECPLWPYRLGHGWQDPETGQISKKTTASDGLKKFAGQKGIRIAAGVSEEENSAYTGIGEDNHVNE